MAPKQATLGYVKTQQTLGKFFGIPNGTKPAKPQQSKLAFSSKSHPPAEDEDLETKDQEAKAGVKKNGIKAENEEDEDAQMTNGDDEASKENDTSRTEKEAGTPELQRSRKRASEDIEEEQNSDLEEEPPSKKQRRKSQPSETKVKSVEDIKAEDSISTKTKPVQDKSSTKESAFSAMVKDKKPILETNDAARSTIKGKPEPNKKAGNKIKEEPESEDNNKAELPHAQREKAIKDESSSMDEEAESDQDDDQETDEEKPEQAAKSREKVQSTLKTSTKDPYPDWEPGEPVPYAALCTTFSKIELTTKRLEIAAHCSLFLRQVFRLTPQDLLPTVHLMTGKLAADYAGIELGIGESLIMKAIGESTGRSLNIIKNDQKAIGDLGLVAAKSRSNQPTMTKPKPLTVRGVHEGLMAIATIEGQGSQGRKIAGIKKLLSAADREIAGKGLKGIDITKDKGGPSESKFIVRTLEGKMRLGLADKTILVALAQASIVHETLQQGDKMPTTDQIAKSETTLKSVYSELPSYEVIIPAIIEHGIFNLHEACKLQPGVPLKPMLAKPTKSITEVLDRFEGKDYSCEYKYDGERAQIHFVAHDAPQQYKTAVPAAGKNAKGISNIFSRNSEDLSKKYPDILAKLPTWVNEDTKSFVLDCETVAWDVKEKKVLPFQQLMTRKRKDVKIEEVTVKVCVFAFDLLFLNGEALVNQPFRTRREKLHTAFTEVEGEFAFAKYGNINQFEEIETLLDASVKASCEGLMVKMLDGAESHYEPSRRSQNWLKVKKDYLSGVGDSLDLVVLGAYFGKGKRTSWYGAFLLACWNATAQTYESVCNIGTGFSEALLEALHAELEPLAIERPKPFYAHSQGNKDQPDVWFEPKLVWEVKAADLTLSPRYVAANDQIVGNGGKGVSLRFPRYIRGRDDKKPEQATMSRQIAEMYREQQSVTKTKGPSVDDDYDFYKSMKIVESEANAMLKRSASLGVSRNARRDTLKCATLHPGRGDLGILSSFKVHARDIDNAVDQAYFLGSLKIELLPPWNLPNAVR
ncbi:MAG: hypothetical protein Q9157_002832 [Trypethelium eluteriae]